ALEEWAFTQVESGRELDEVLRDVLTGNECCAVLGIASTLALAHNHLSAVTLPLATSQRLWHWDIQRSVQDTPGAAVNMIGFGVIGADDAHAAAVRALNARPVRRKVIRTLAMLFVIAGDESLRKACRSALEAFSTNLPFEFQSQQQN